MKMCFNEPFTCNKFHLQVMVENAKCAKIHKSAFQDALPLRYCWPPLCTPALCACGSSFSVEHVLSCPKGGLPSLRHNEIRDLTATLPTEIYHQVCVVPELQPVDKRSSPLPLLTPKRGRDWMWL